MKVALITGGSRGIGAAIVEKFANNNYSVVLNYNKSEFQSKQLQNKLINVGCDVHLFRADVSNSNQVEEMFRYVSKYFKHLDVLVCNAGIDCYRLCQDYSESEYDQIMDINAKGTFLCCKEAIKLFLPQKTGTIVNVSSIWGIRGASCESVYSMSKHAIVGLTKSLAEELSLSGIKVNCICPPIVRTAMCADFSDNDIADFCKEHNLRLFSAEQVADDVFRLAKSEKSGEIFVEQ